MTHFGDNIARDKETLARLNNTAQHDFGKDLPHYKVCKVCNKEYDTKEAQRLYGTSVRLESYCTPECYTNAIIENPELM